MKRDIYFISLLLIVAAPLYPFFYDGATYTAQKGEWQQAHEKFNKLLVDNPDSADIAYDAGVVAYNLEHFSQAQAYFLRAAEKATSSEFACRAYYNAGNASVALKNLKTALEQYDKALAKDPCNEYVRYNRDKVAEMLKQQEQQEQQKKDQNEKDSDEKQDKENQQDKQQGDDQDNQDGDNQDENQDDGDGGNEQESDHQKGQQQKNKKKQKKPGSSAKDRDEQSQDNDGENTENSDTDQKRKNLRDKKNQQEKSQNNKERDADQKPENKSSNAKDERSKQQGNKHDGSSSQGDDKQSDSSSVASENNQAQAKKEEKQLGIAEQQTEAGMHQELENKLQDQWLVSVLDKQEDRDKAMNKRLMGLKIRQHGGNNVQNAW